MQAGRTHVLALPANDRCCGMSGTGWAMRQPSAWWAKSMCTDCKSVPAAEAPKPSGGEAAVAVAGPHAVAAEARPPRLVLIKTAADLPIF